MFGKTEFNRAQFNVSGGGEPSLYATVTSEYSVVVQAARARVMIAPVTVNAAATLEAGLLWLFAPLTAVTAEAEYEVEPNMTALCPITTVTLAAESSIIARLAGRIPLDTLQFPAEFGVQTVLWAKTPLSPATLKAETAMSARLGTLVPMSAVTHNAEFGLRGTLWAKVPLSAATMLSEMAFSAKAIRTSESEEMVLEGLNLAPGQMLIIDTDTLEIEVDGVVRVDCWVTGGSFFQFRNGTNTLTFTDNAARRNLRVTVLWADRYL